MNEKIQPITAYNVSNSFLFVLSCADDWKKFNQSLLIMLAILSFCFELGLWMKKIQPITACNVSNSFLLFWAVLMNEKFTNHCSQCGWFFLSCVELCITTEQFPFYSLPSSLFPSPFHSFPLSYIFHTCSSSISTYSYSLHFNTSWNMKWHMLFFPKINEWMKELGKKLLKKLPSERKNIFHHNPFNLFS